MMRRRFLILLLAVAWPAAAQHAHHKPKHGGVIRESASHQVYELVVTPTRIAVWATDEDNKPVGTAGASATVTLIDSGSRVEVPLTPAGENRLDASGAYTVKKGMTALLTVQVGGKEIARLRYTLK